MTAQPANHELDHLIVATMKLARQLAEDGWAAANDQMSPPDANTSFADEVATELSLLCNQYDRRDLTAAAFVEDEPTDNKETH